MNSFKQQKYGQVQQIGSTEEIANPITPNVKEQSTISEVHEAARILYGIKNGEKVDWVEVPYRKRREKKSLQHYESPPIEQEFEMNAHLGEKQSGAPRDSKRHNALEVKKRTYRKMVSKVSPQAERGNYFCNRCGDGNKKDHVCRFKVVEFKRVSVPPRDIRDFRTFYKCGRCGDYKDDHLCVPIYEHRTVDEMLIAQRYFELCEHFPVRRREINNKIWAPGEIEERIAHHPKKTVAKMDIEPHGWTVHPLTESLVDETEAACWDDALGGPFPNDEDPPLSAADERRVENTKQDLIENLRDLLSVVPEDTSPETDRMMSHVENVAIFAIQLYSATTFTQAVAACLGFVKMNYNGSVMKKFMTYVENMWDENVVPQASYSAKEMWMMIRDNEVFASLKTLLSAVMSVSACSVKGIEWSPCGFEFVKIAANEQTAKAVDVIDCCITLFTWFCETGYEVIRQRSLLPLLYGNQHIVKFNQECDYVTSRISQLIAGNLEGISVEDFENKVDWCLQELQKMRDLKCKGPTPIWISARFKTLMECKNKIIAHHKSATLRYFPFCVAVTGETGIGKTGISKNIMKLALGAGGFDTDVRRQRTRNWDQKHDNEIVSDVLGLFYDDVGAAKAQFVERSEAAAFIHENNGVPLCANKAELESKGITFFQHKVAVLTSNFRSLNFEHYSDYPAAALSRLVFVRVKVKNEYTDNNGVSLNKDHPVVQKSTPSSDLWDITMEKVQVVTQPNGKTSFYFAPFKGQFGGEYFDTSSMTVTQCYRLISLMARNHKVQQEQVMSKTREIDEMPLCKECRLFQEICTCKVFDPEEVEVHAIVETYAAEIVQNALMGCIRSYWNYYISPVAWWTWALRFSYVRNKSTAWLASKLSNSFDDWVTEKILSFVPRWVEQSTLYQSLLEVWQQAAAVHDSSTVLKCVLVCSALVWWITWEHFWYGYFVSWSYWYSLFLWLILLLTYANQYQARLRLIREAYIERRDALPTFYETLRKPTSTEVGLSVVAIAIGLKLLYIWNERRTEPQSTQVLPSTSAPPQQSPVDGKKTADDTPAIDNDKQQSWLGSMMDVLGVKVQTSPGCRNVSTQDMVSAFSKNNLFHATVCYGDVRVRCNIFFPKKGLALLPSHVFHDKNDLSSSRYPGAITVTVRRHDKPGGIFEFKADDSNTIHDKRLDCAAIHVPNCPDFKDRTSWLPITHPAGTALATLLVRKENEFLSDNISVVCKTVAHKYRSDLPGGSYRSKLAQNGACMGLIVADQKTPCILGVHIGGATLRDYGIMQTVLQADVQRWLTELEKKNCFPLAQPTDLPKTQYSRDVITSETVHPHSVFSHLEVAAQVDILGSTKLRTKQKTVVQPSILSDHVADVCGVPRRWAGPKLEPNWKAYNATLVHAVDPARPFDPALMQEAGADWLEPLIPLVDSTLRPLTDKEAIMGCPGVRFLDALPMSTSMGFPLFGKKSNYFEDVIVDGQLWDRVPCPEIATEVERLRACWSRGERAYPVTSATLKDEPTALKMNDRGEWELPDKVRVFQCSPVAMSICIRKYFLPIARFLSLHPLESECAVGLNCMSQQWEVMMEHALKFADGQAFAFDYSKYDVRMNSQITHFAWTLLILLAQRSSSYSADDIQMMKMMLADIVHPLIDWNGTLIMLWSMNTSGHNLTVNINSCANSVLTRMGFFFITRLRNFRQHVACTTYGDDFLGSVRKDCRTFNFCTYKNFLAEHGMKITLPSKTDDVQEFLPTNEVDFLKRRSNFIPEIGHALGALDEDSIFKSLHANLRSKSQSPREVAASCMEGAMHEWFAHGREVYEKRRQQMETVCERARLPVPAVKISFDDRVDHWKIQNN
nr:MAG: hypothetical protein 1 [Salisharnavirus sp.]